MTILSFFVSGKIIAIRKPSVCTSKGITRQLRGLLDDLKRAFSQADQHMQELESEIEARELELIIIDKKSKELQTENVKMQRRVNILKNMPIEVGEYFQGLNQTSIESMERRNFRRDIIMFVLGMVLSTIVTILASIVVANTS